MPLSVSRDEIERALGKGRAASADDYYPNGGQETFWRTAASSPDYEAIVREIRDEGERFMKEPIPELGYALFALFEKQGTRLEYESVYFGRRRRLNTFVLLTLLEPDNEEYRSRLHEIVWAICDEYTWCLPAHVRNTEVRGAIDLFASETGFALSEIALLLGDRLPAMLRVRIAEEAERRLFVPYLEGGPFGWETAKHNWSAVCAGSIGSAALLLMKEPDRLAAVIGKALASLDCYLEGFGGDGACLEGIGYWNYGFGYFTYFADLLRRRTGEAIDPFRPDKIRSIALFQQKCYLDGDWTVNFSDSLPRSPVQLGLTHYLAGLYPEMDLPPSSVRAAYTEDHCSRWAPAFRNIVWFDPAKRETAWRPADYYLPDAEWLVSRHESEFGRFGFAAKGGHNDEPHNHNDVGQFILHAGGRPFVADLGSGEYTAGYFGEGRYDIACNGSQGHSVPIADGVLQAPGPLRAAKVLEASTGEAEDRLALELAAAYPAERLASLVRRLVWRKTALPMLELTDEFAFSSVPGEIAERIVTPCSPLLEEGSVLLRAEGAFEVRIVYDPERLEPSAEARSDRDQFGKARYWHTVDFKLRRPAQTAKAELRFEIIRREREG